MLAIKYLFSILNTEESPYPPLPPYRPESCSRRVSPQYLPPPYWLHRSAIRAPIGGAGPRDVCMWCPVFSKQFLPPILILLHLAQTIDHMA